MRVSTLALIASLTLGALTSEAQVIGTGNGGGGVTRNGRYMTFYTAGIYTSSQEEDVSSVPQLSDLVTFFNETQLLGVASKVAYAKALTPSAQRKYFKVDSTRFTPEIRERLIAEYGRVMHIDTQEIALFAITDTEAKTTYLLPEFYTLTAIEQKAILFHEAFWLCFPKATYSAVISAETSFQSYLEKPKSPDRLARWLESSGTAKDRFAMALNADLASNALRGFIDRDTKIQLRKFVGEDYVDCLRQTSGETCVPYLASYAYQLSIKYPNSQVIKYYSSALSLNAFGIVANDKNLLKTSYDMWSEFEDFWNASFKLKDAIFNGYTPTDVSHRGRFNDAFVIFF